MSSSPTAVHAKGGPRDWSDPNINRFRVTHNKIVTEFFFPKPFLRDIPEKWRGKIIIVVANHIMLEHARVNKNRIWI